MKTGAHTRWGRAVPIRRNKTIEAEHYAKRVEEARSKRDADKAKSGRKRADDNRRDEIAALIRQCLTKAEVMRRAKCGDTLYEDVRSDMLLGKHGGFAR